MTGAGPAGGDYDTGRAAAGQGRAGTMDGMRGSGTSTPPSTSPGGTGASRGAGGQTGADEAGGLAK